MIVLPKHLIAEDVVPKQLPQDLTKLELVQKVYKYADEYDVNPKTMVRLINCENTDWDTDLQSRIVNKKGIREKSYGLSQIHLPDHPDITKEQATDADFSLKFMAENLKKGKGTMWSCYKKNA